ncbi:MAG: hypothetical protein PHP98_00560 [Kiritimatiellae bacterium]|nr:hypothetical protein [Kiritimatiellia bacterium]
MASEKITVVGDGHFHFYPCYDPAEAVACLFYNLGRLAAAAGNFAPGTDVFRIAFLAESGQCDYFRKILGGEISFRKSNLEVAAGPEAHCVSFSKENKEVLCLVAGRQVVTREKIEILGLGMEAVVPDGLAAEEAVETVLAAGGLPVLAFSPGKWLFKRGKIALELFERYSKSLVIGDSALRPHGWPEPGIMRRANGKILPGSDPLPLPGEEKYAGSYGFVCRGAFDISKPLRSMMGIMANTPLAVAPAGRRCSLPATAGKLYRLWRAKKSGH